ncbi:hypothetical protein TSAR_010928 [Trichomalopsis sarcophagae]|uniref:EGF-like domain-containing protein n=1 Tax=Trichomalopsis sarcophagae TaxID=543379 RepID=A0A232FDQ1_9HYME|nr:hypothetical protein TSAR_010928 [Trichomalopsis sarcophagae]
MKIIHAAANAVVLLLLCFTVSTSSDKAAKKRNSEEAKNMQLPPCASCKVLVESFKKGIEKTSRGKFEGGDSAWEEDKLGSYKTSEVRLIEIQEGLCKDLDYAQTQCHSLAEDLESFVEEWWFKRQDSHPDLYSFLCIEKAERCCPKDQYGPNCDKCPGYPDNVCNSNGKCKGSGTRKGNGKCTCDKGYSGELCFDCAAGFYQSFKDEKKLLCSPCHKACKGLCTGGGPRDCHECNPGWKKIDGKGCHDIDECLERENSCPDNHFCVNNEGNFSCIACDKACDGCSGDGPDMCNVCAEGYNKKGSICVNSDILGRKTYENWTRYLTYLGLAVATSIILQRNVYAASVIGLCVAIYISVSEYLIAHSGIQDTMPNIGIIDKLS